MSSYRSMRYDSGINKLWLIKMLRKYNIRCRVYFASNRGLLLFLSFTLYIYDDYEQKKI